MKNLYKFFVLFLLFGSLNAFASAEIKIIHIADLPLWKGEINGLLWLTSSKNNLNFGRKVEIDLNTKPLSRVGVIDYPTKIDDNLWERFHMVDIFDFESKRLLDGWKVSYERGKCDTGILTVKKDNGFGDVWVIKKGRGLGLLRSVICLGTGASAYYAVLLNSRYFAFATADGGYIFFDRQYGKFLPLIILNNPNLVSNFYATPDGRILIDAYFGEIDSFRHTPSADRKTDGVREILYLNKPLIAPIAENEKAQINFLYKETYCLICKSHGYDGCEVDIFKESFMCTGIKRK